MKLIERLWAGVNYAIHVFTLSSTYDVGGGQQAVVDLHPLVSTSVGSSVFSSPAGPQSIECDYSRLDDGGWTSCNTPTNRTCWLKHRNGSVIDINTRYETANLATGVTRKYHLVVSNTTLNTDGFNMTEAKVFNGEYPGPWLQACWGDDIEVSVFNNLTYNGTVVHWHGIRQHNSVLMDGVNGVTQCPIPPKGSMTYRFATTQYGTSWYHSHYSLQYGDGLLGPMTIHGPSSADTWAESKEPILMSDWGHRSAFQEFQVELQGRRPQTNSILMNGRGNWSNPANLPGVNPPGPHRETFKEGTRYLMRIINTAVDTTFIFSIDDHDLTIIGSDFVPIKPYTNSSVLVGIGQRYHIVVEAKPISKKLGDGNFWMRATPAARCQSFADPVDEKVGIVTYEGHEPVDVPTTKRRDFAIKCSDETYSDLKPVVPWRVGRPSNPQAMFEAGLTIPSSDKNIVLPHGGFVRWSLGDHPMWLDMREPTMTNIGKYDGVEKVWAPDLVLLDMEYADDDWVYLVITATSTAFKGRLRKFVPAAHPIHLHGHDFALLAQSDRPYWEQMVDLQLDNPPRRDVVLLPANGYVVIAFKADNPGAWLLHCHIAMHASSGLALQILERQRDLMATYLRARRDAGGRPLPAGPRAAELNATRDTCAAWKRWQNDANNWWDAEQFQDDSGI